MEEIMHEPDEYPDVEDWDDEYISEEDAAEDCSCYIDDDGNWVPMSEEMEEALYEARAYQNMIAGLKKKYAAGKPVPAPKEQWPEMIAEWRKTECASKPWFHLHVLHNESDPADVERIKQALILHHLEFDVTAEDYGDTGIWVDSPMGKLLDECDIGRMEEILNAVTVTDDVPYMYGLPAPVYVRYVNEQEEYSWIPQPEYEMIDEMEIRSIKQNDDPEELPF